MKKLVGSLLVFVLLLSLVGVSTAEEEYDEYMLDYYSYQVPSGWLFQEIYPEETNDESDALYMTAHFAKAEESASGGAILTITSYANAKMADLEDNEAVIEEWVARIAEEAEQMNLEKIEKLLVSNTDALLYAGHMDTDSENTPVSIAAWEYHDILYAMIYANSEYSLDQVIAFTKSLLSRVEFQPAQNASAECEIVKEFKRESSLGYHNDLVVRNNSGYDAIISLDVLFFDKDGNVVGVREYEGRACEDGYEMFWQVSNDLPFDRIECFFLLIPDTQGQGLQSVVELTTNILENKKVIISAKNTGDKPIEYINCFILFLDENGNVVDSNWEVLAFTDDELMPGATKYGEVKSTEDYDTVELYATKLSPAGASIAVETAAPTSAEYEVIKEYKWQSSIGYHNDLVIRNTSGFDALIYLDVLFFDKDGNVIGVADDVKGACQYGHDTFWSISNDLPFDHVEYVFTMVPDTQGQGLQSAARLSVNILENGKVIYSATNISDKPIGMLEYYLIFLDINGNIVDYAWEFLGDFDGELKPGATLYGEVKTTQDYVSIDLYATSM
ncbi:MAG: hypothetical protein ACOX6Y_02275 [Christensenellales bacterium]|jgi:hypothetical protein